MSTRLATIDRIIIFLLGLVFIAAGAWAIALWAGCSFIEDLAARVDTAAIGRFPDNSWYTVTLVLVMILGVILGLWLIIANLRQRRFNRVRSSASDNTGSISITLTKLAGVIDDQLSSQSRVSSVRHKVAMDRSRPTITYTITAEAGVDAFALRREIEQAEHDFREAVRDLDVDTVYRLHLQPVKR